MGIHQVRSVLSKFLMVWPLRPPPPHCLYLLLNSIFPDGQCSFPNLLLPCHPPLTLTHAPLPPLHHHHHRNHHPNTSIIAVCCHQPPSPTSSSPPSSPPDNHHHHPTTTNSIDSTTNFHLQPIVHIVILAAESHKSPQISKSIPKLNSLKNPFSNKKLKIEK